MFDICSLADKPYGFQTWYSANMFYDIQIYENGIGNWKESIYSANELISAEGEL